MAKDKIFKDDNINILALDNNPRVYHKAEIDYKTELYMSCIANNVTNFLEAYNLMVRENGQSIYTELDEEKNCLYAWFNLANIQKAIQR